MSLEPRFATAGAPETQKIGERGEIVVICPVYNDWEAVVLLVRELDKMAQLRTRKKLHLLIMDDSSVTGTPGVGALQTELLRVDVLRLRYNRGHQGALFEGLHSVNADTVSHIVLIDADGEDNPEDIIALLERAATSSAEAVVAQRGNRVTSRSFKLFYFLHRLSFRSLTGQTLDFGNFMLLKPSTALRLREMPEAAAHIAAALLKSRAVIERVPTNRRARQIGDSKTGFEGLLAHSVAAHATFAERILIRFGILNLILTATAAVSVAVVVAMRLLTDIPEPGWSTTVTGFLGLLVIQLWAFWALAALHLMGNRSIQNFLGSIQKWTPGGR